MKLRGWEISAGGTLWPRRHLRGNMLGFEWAHLTAGFHIRLAVPPLFACGVMWYRA